VKETSRYYRSSFTKMRGSSNYQKNIYDWRPLTRVEAAYPGETNADSMLAKCAGVARELNIPRERYRCIRTK